jgi:hypothetical protein
VFASYLFQGNLAQATHRFIALGQTVFDSVQRSGIALCPFRQTEIRSVKGDLILSALETTGSDVWYADDDYGTRSLFCSRCGSLLPRLLGALTAGAISLHEVISSVLATDGKLKTNRLPSPSLIAPEQVRGCFGATTAPRRAGNVEFVWRYDSRVAQAVKSNPAHGMPEAEDGMIHKLTRREVYDALREQRQGHPGEYIAGFSTWVDGKVCFDALALRLNEIIFANGNRDAVVRAVTRED